ncbi:hypothetical protein C5L39_05445 [Corynebacterium alimapuense]|uniref:Uncharacterized protein n=1 Tax=Corynebacterium alimapuense TaxID=1576874 RepID=A0A3M8K6A6_9CORY|nr:hypothetical protein C5L39_05445 [Corynebacterium alimapuense]
MLAEAVGEMTALGAKYGSSAWGVASGREFCPSTFEDDVGLNGLRVVVRAVPESAGTPNDCVAVSEKDGVGGELKRQTPTPTKTAVMRPMAINR